MCSVLTHPIVPVALAAFLPHDTVSPTLVLVGAACAVIPDLDVIGRKFGVGAHPLLGHRGVTHSIAFAVVLAAMLTYTLFHNSSTPRWVIFLFLCVSTLSHPLLDMLTNGGSGVALFAPFSSVRYFFAWRPIEVSPISMRGFFSRRGVQILRSELRWVWLPSVGVCILGLIVRR